MDRRAVQRLAARLGRGTLALITGPSGSGKSTLLRAVAARLEARGRVLVRVGATIPANRAVVDLMPGTLGDAIAGLARAGLGDALLLGRAPEELSDGQRWRLGMALAMAGAGRGAVLAADEFAAVLDRPTARCLCLGVRRWVTREGAALVVATSHDDVRTWLDPDVVAECAADGVRVVGRGGGG